ncbi:vesicle transport protein SFT2B [Pyrus ussuriensis x Pyrus communis]|uniref:Vesicle transport protein n=1 Tax=Pyrus ussuriensis x Pyrus communis TaxID=2448454 RepID=A0A5N5H2M2_9ROSA|nr:vesicle transport protein SFT2B [Pyrus ussuriensis x Pyrus communis]
MWGKLNQSTLGDNEEGGESLLDEESEGLFNLSATQSMIVFAKPIKFAVLFTFGNLLAVGSTAFLFGPARQMRMMFDTVRVFATAIYLGCVVLALICALLIRSKILTIIAIICEICALIWYSLSYIPFARRMVSGLMIRLCDTEL